MKRVIFDTNIYGILAIDEDRLRIVDRLKNTKKIIIYGFKIVRNELRDVPKSLKIQNKSLRIDLLNLYDSIVEEHVLDFDISFQNNDEKSMLSEKAIKAYNLINSVINKKTPKFMTYKELKNLLRGASNEFV